MVSSKVRYALPVLFFVVGVWAAIQIIVDVTVAAEASDILSVWAGSAYEDILFVIAVGIPILLVEYMGLSVPLAIVFLVVARNYKRASYEMNIMNIGSEFGGARMIRRAVAPALFSVSTSEFLKGWVRGNVFTLTDLPSELQTLYGPINMQVMYEISLTLIASLLLLVVVLPLFSATWVLNDAGVVTHLKEDKMRIRQCPDMQGVGRWVGNTLGGYALIAFPVAMFLTQFYQPYLVDLRPITPTNLLISFLWILGLPLLVMAFIIPIIVLNELSQKRIRKRITSYAVRLGATVVLKRKVEKVEKPEILVKKKRKEMCEGILEADEVVEIVTSAKGVKTYKRKKNKKRPPKKE
ncbi:MAG: hypothetical protein JSW05_12615 [Candidatus Thorarchaeota archaeon]|nr:MAG: hypothetical protein JSW05_12615 [Candidatus Thorarchaeota archaeon]